MRMTANSTRLADLNTMYFALSLPTSTLGFRPAGLACMFLPESHLGSNLITKL